MSYTEALASLRAAEKAVEEARERLESALTPSEALKLMSEKVGAAQSLLLEAKELSVIANVPFRFYFYDSTSGEEAAEEAQNWQSSSADC